MSQEDYIKEHFNKVDTITAKYVSNESWADGIKDELEEGKIYTLIPQHYNLIFFIST